MEFNYSKSGKWDNCGSKLGRLFIDLRNEDKIFYCIMDILKKEYPKNFHEEIKFNYFRNIIHK